MKALNIFHFKRALTRTALIVAGLSGLNAKAAPRFEFQGIGTLGGATSSARGLNDHGQIVGSSQIGEGPDVHAFLYSDGAMRDLGTLGGINSVATGINNRGQVVGNSVTSIFGTPTRGFIYSNGVMRDIGTVDRTKGSSAANAINDSGQLAGNAVSLVLDSTGRPVVPVHAIVYSNGSMTDIGALGGVQSVLDSSANAINASGQIVGVSDIGNLEESPREAVIYSGGIMRSLGRLGGNFSEATAINDGGEIAGNTMVPSSTDVRHAFRYVNGDMFDLGTLGGRSSAANAINNSGQIVGHADITGAPPPQRVEPVPADGQHATLWNGNIIHDLNTLAPTGWTLTDAAAINRYAQIVGTGMNQDHPEGEAFLLTLHPDWQGDGNGNWDDGSHWNFAGMGSFGIAPGAPHDVVINPEGNATINGGANASVRNLSITGNAGKLVTFNLNGGSTTSMQGTTLNHATLAGSGTLEGGLTISADSRVDVAGGERMQWRGGQVNNAGLIRVLGGGGNRAALEANGPVINAGGEINLENAALSLLGGLENRGQIKVSFGASSISGDLTSAQDSKIILSGSSETTFWDNVTMQSGSELRLAANASAVFFGQVNVRNGALLTGAGTSFYEGGLSLGNSPGMVTNAGSVSFGQDNVYLAEIGGLIPGEQFDQLQVGGTLSFGGTLKLMWWDNFNAKVGDVFDLFDWGNSAGRFTNIDTGAARLTNGLRWDFSRLYSTGEIGVAAVPLPGAAWLFIGGLLTVLRFNRNSKAGSPI